MDPKEHKSDWIDEVCPECKGAKANRTRWSASNPERCPKCHGTGRVAKRSR